MSNWYRLAYPPTRWVVSFLLIIVLFDVGIAGVIALYPDEAGVELPRNLFAPILMIIGFGAVGLAGFRLVRLPISNGPAGDYSGWLSATTWQSDNRLPFGPWHPIALDLVPLGILGAMSVGHMWAASSTGFHRVFLWFSMMPAFVFAFIWVLGGYIMLHKSWTFSKPVILLWLSGLGHLIVLISSHEVPLGALVAYSIISAAVSFLLVWRKLASALAEIPTRYYGPSEHFDNSEHTLKGTYDVLAPGYRPALGFGETAQRYRSVFGATLLAAIGCSYTFLFWWGDDKFSLALSALVCAFIGLAGSAVFASRQLSNLGLLARWARRQFLVPAYDCVSLIFWSAIAVGGVLVSFGFAGLIPPSIAGSAAIGATTFVTLRMGRDRRHWSLTAPCRYDLVKPRATIT